MNDPIQDSAAEAHRVRLKMIEPYEALIDDMAGAIVSEHDGMYDLHVATGLAEALVVDLVEGGWLVPIELCRHYDQLNIACTRYARPNHDYCDAHSVY